MRVPGLGRPGRLAGLVAAALLAGALTVEAEPLPGAEATASAQEDIRDIRLPRLPVPAWLWAALLCGGGSLALIAFLVWRRRRHGSTVAASPYETALRRLEETRELMRPAGSDEFSVAVSGILRTYVEQAFLVTATQRTTEEFLRDLVDSSNAALARHRGQLAAFLQQCDLVKFAGTSLSPHGMESLYRSARAFVSETAGHTNDPVSAA